MKLSRTPQSDQGSEIPWIISQFNQVEYYGSFIKMSLIDQSTGKESVPKSTYFGHEM